MQGWMQHSQHEWSLLSLPDRHWKWRMRYSAIYMAEQVTQSMADDGPFDVLFVSDMMNVAEFRGLLPKAVRDIPIIVYFHENQFAYPTPKDKQPDPQFGMINFLSVLAADEIWFNSRHNLDSFLQNVTRHCSTWPDWTPNKAIAELERRALYKCSNRVATKKGCPYSRAAVAN